MNDLDEVIDRARTRIVELENTNDELLAIVRGYQVEIDRLIRLAEGSTELLAIVRGYQVEIDRLIRLAEGSTEQIQQLISMNEQLLALNAALQSELEQALGDSPRNVH